MKFFKVDNVEALAVLVQSATECGESVTFVTPISDYYVVQVTGQVEVSKNISEVSESVLNAVGPLPSDFIAQRQWCGNLFLLLAR